MSFKKAALLINLRDLKTCSICLLECRDKKARQRHEAIVHSNDGQQFKCDLCPKSYTNRNALSYHNGKKHQQPVLKHPCDLCELHFATKATAPARSQAVCLNWEMAQHKVLAPRPCTNVMLTEHVLSVRHTHNVLVYLIAAMGVDAYADILIMGLVTPPLATYVTMGDAGAGKTMLVLISIIDIPDRTETVIKKMVSITVYLN